MLSQLVEQSACASGSSGTRWNGERAGRERPLPAVLAATAVSEAVSACILLLFFTVGRRCVRSAQKRPGRPADPARRLWEILWPVEGGRWPAPCTRRRTCWCACLTVCLLDAGGRSAAVAQYGSLKGDGPLPSAHLSLWAAGELSVLLMPEITQAHIRGERPAGLPAGPDAPGCDGLLLGAGWGAVLGVGRATGPLPTSYSQEAGFYLRVLGPAMPLMVSGRKWLDVLVWKTA